MKTFASLFAAFALLLSTGACIHAEEIKNADVKSQVSNKNAGNEFLENSLAQGGGYCWSGKNCTGKILGFRDPHNCKVKSSGKSWSVDKDGEDCQNL